MAVRTVMESPMLKGWTFKGQWFTDERAIALLKRYNEWANKKNLGLVFRRLEHDHRTPGGLIC